jgi:hypothetical protein
LLTQGLLASTRTLFGPIEYLNSVIGQIVYLPGKDYYGIDTITYNVSDAVNDTTGSIDVMVSVPSSAPYFEQQASFVGVEDEDVVLTGVEIMGKPVNVESYIVQLTIDVAGGAYPSTKRAVRTPRILLGRKSNSEATAVRTLLLLLLVVVVMCTRVLPLLLSR